MLLTTPQSLGEKLPMVSESGELVITADARIDNREELQDALGLSKSAEAELADSELILNAYEKWGDRCPEHLLGAFSFVIWDGKKQALLCARDHMGVKPFYYHISDKLFTFASEIKALTCLPDVPRRLNETKVAEYLVPIQEDKTFTFYQGILRLPPGHYMKVDKQGARLSQYWSLDPSREIKLGSDEEYAEAFLEIFTEAVRCRLRSAYPVASLLSGGLDSSSITCVAKELIGGNGDPGLTTFSAVFDHTPECDERSYINHVLDQGGVKPNYLLADEIGTFSEVERTFFHQDEPFIAMILLIHRALFKTVGDHGVRILLDGLDGDATVSYGLQSFAELARRGRWLTLAKEVRQYAGYADAQARLVFWRYAVKPMFPDSLRPMWRAIRGVNNLGMEMNPALRPEFARRVGLEERLQALHGPLSLPPRTVRDNHYRRLNWGLYPLILEIADKDAAGFGVEPRYPFFDKRLLEFCLALPSEQKYSQGWPRVIHRRSLAQVLPKEVAWRWRKTSLSMYFRTALTTADRDKVEKILSKPPDLVSDYVDVPFLRETFQKFLSSQIHTREGLHVWRAANLGLWLNYSGIRP
jgi:asparagine synthase (glutamine-hydrolysing)